MPARRATEAIRSVVRTGCRWRAPNAAGIRSPATAERRFRGWKRAGVFARPRAAGVDRAHAAGAVDDWAFLAVDGRHAEAPLARTEKGARRAPAAAGRGPSGRRRPTATASS